MPILDLNDEQKVEEYDHFVATSPYGHMMQSRAWSDVKNNWEHDYVYTEDEEGRINGALSILSVKNDGENAFLYAPRGPVCDPKDTEHIDALIAEAKPVVEKHNGFLLRMDPEIEYAKELETLYEDAGYTIRPSIDDASESKYTNPPYNMILYLDGKTADDIMASYKRKDRHAVRKTYKDGLYTKMYKKEDEAFQDALVILNDLMQTVADREDISLRNLEYLQRLTDAFDDVVIFETHHPDGEILASSVVVSYNNKSFYIYAGSSNNHRNMNASAQMNQEAIEYALERGSKEYDMGGIFSTDPADGLYRFKRKFAREDDYTRFFGEIDIVYDKDLYEEFNK